MFVLPHHHRTQPYIILSLLSFSLFNLFDLLSPYLFCSVAHIQPVALHQGALLSIYNIYLTASLGL